MRDKNKPLTDSELERLTENIFKGGRLVNDTRGGINLSMNPGTILLNALMDTVPLNEIDFEGFKKYIDWLEGKVIMEKDKG